MRQRFIAVVCLIVVAIFAQSASAQTLGAKGGINLTNISFDEGSFASESTAGAGFTVGGVVGFKLFGPLAVQAEVLFTEQRLTIEDVVTDRFRVLEVPVLLRYRVFGTLPKMTVHVTGGVVYGPVLAARETVGGETNDIKAAVRSTNLGAAIGADVEFRPRWIADVRYIYGLSKVYNTFAGGEAGTPKSIQITIGYRFK
jgi:hypothetical protein